MTIDRSIGYTRIQISITDSRIVVGWLLSAIVWFWGLCLVWRLAMRDRQVVKREIAFVVRGSSASASAVSLNYSNVSNRDSCLLPISYNKEAGGGGKNETIVGHQRRRGGGGGGISEERRKGVMAVHCVVYLRQFTRRSSSCCSNVHPSLYF